MNIINRLLNPSAERFYAERNYDILRALGQVYVEQDIKQRVTSRASQDELVNCMDTSFNALKYIANRLSIHQPSPERKFSNERDRELFNKVTENKFNAYVDEIRRLAFSTSRCLARPRLAGERIVLDNLAANQCEVDYLNDKPFEVAYFFSKDIVIVTDPVYDRYYNTEGAFLFASPHGLDQQPWVEFKLADSPPLDLFEAFINVCIMNTLLARMQNYGSFNQITKKDQGLSQGEISYQNESIGPGEFLKGDYSTINLAGDIEAFERVIKNKIAQTLIAHSVFPENFVEVTFTSGADRKAAFDQENKQKAKIIAMIRGPELELIRNVIALQNASSGDHFNGDIVAVDYADPAECASESDRVNLYQKKIDMGVASPVDFIMEANPDVTTREEAMVILKRNLDENQQVLEYKQKFQQNSAAQILGSLGGRPSTQPDPPKIQ